MIEFEILQELEPNTEILEIIKNYDYAIKNGKIKHLMTTNLQFTQPIEYAITKPATVNFANYPYIIFVSSKIMEMDSAQQNKVALYLFNSINFKIKNCKSLDNKEQMF